MEHLTLSDAAPGKRYTIREIKDEARLVNRLSSMGLVCGSPLEVCQNRSKQPVLVFARDTLVAIGREKSRNVRVCEQMKKKSLSGNISGQRLLLFALCGSTFLLDIPFRMCYFRATN